MDLSWLFNTIVSLANCNPMLFMVHNWFEQRGKTTGKLASAGFLQAMALSVIDGEDPGGRSNMWVDPTTIDEDKTHGNIITGSKRHGYHIDKTSIRLPAGSLVCSYPRGSWGGIGWRLTSSRGFTLRRTATDQ